MICGLEVADNGTDFKPIQPIQSATHPSNHRDHPLKTARQFEVCELPNLATILPALPFLTNVLQGFFNLKQCVWLLTNQGICWENPTSTIFSKTSGAKQPQLLGPQKGGSIADSHPGYNHSKEIVP